MAPKFACPHYFVSGFKLSQGVHSHIMQTARCRTKMEASFQSDSAQSDNENLSGSSRGLSLENDIPMDIDDEEPPYTRADPSHNMPEDNPIPSP